jgi:hypothetical protein
MAERRRHARHAPAQSLENQPVIFERSEDDDDEDDDGRRLLA